ncbi:hypothetical protein C8R43DRAFT_1233392 [Mycena crocata]|nr:hypothetical protein C8R43DRAFT_1233392 [Mycena crocata]
MQFSLMLKRRRYKFKGWTGATDARSVEGRAQAQWVPRDRFIFSRVGWRTPHDIIDCGRTLSPSVEYSQGTQHSSAVITCVATMKPVDERVPLHDAWPLIPELYISLFARIAWILAARFLSGYASDQPPLSSGVATILFSYRSATCLVLASSFLGELSLSLLIGGHAMACSKSDSMSVAREERKIYPLCTCTSLPACISKLIQLGHTGFRLSYVPQPLKSDFRNFSRLSNCSFSLRTCEQTIGQDLGKCIVAQLKVAYFNPRNYSFLRLSGLSVVEQEFRFTYFLTRDDQSVPNIRVATPPLATGPNPNRPMATCARTLDVAATPQKLNRSQLRGKVPSPSRMKIIKSPSRQTA